MKSVLVIDNYDSFTYNIVALLYRLGIRPQVVDNNSIPLSGRYDRVIISPGPGNPANAPDRGNIFEFLSQGNYGRVLGVCFGHQALALYLGSDVYRNSVIMHGEIDTIKHSESDLFRSVPEVFSAIRYHSLVITGNPEILVTARSTRDGSIMAFESVDKRFYGLQFHPESIYSQFGETILGNFIGE